MGHFRGPFEGAQISITRTITRTISGTLTGTMMGTITWALARNRSRSKHRARENRDLNKDRIGARHLESGMPLRVQKKVCRRLHADWGTCRDQRPPSSSPQLLWDTTVVLSADTPHVLSADTEADRPVQSPLMHSFSITGSITGWSFNALCVPPSLSITGSTSGW